MSKARTACKRTLAPFSISCGRENSLGEWLIPPMLGMKIMPMGPMRAIYCASWPAPLGIDLVENPSERAMSPINFCMPGSVNAG